jgi:hypothetical protein
VGKGAAFGWLKITKQCKLHITGKEIKKNDLKKKSCTISITKGLKVKKGNKKEIKTLVQDEFTIGGFKVCRTSEFENK